MEKIEVHRVNLDKCTEKINGWKVPAEVRRDIKRFLSDLEIGKVNRGVRVSERRRVKYLYCLRVPLEQFAKPTARITVKDVERFEKRLTSDQIVSLVTHQPFAHATKNDIRKCLKVFIRWRLGPAKALKLVGWLDTREQIKTQEYLEEKEVQQLFKNCRTNEQRYLIAVLFDSGARAEEFLNIRLEDIQLPKPKETFVRLTLREEFSKFKGRTISLYWEHSLTAVQAYLSERVAAGIQRGQPLSTGTYGSLRMFLGRLGRRVLNKRVHPHLFWHSSATHYASKLNSHDLCYRYGWNFSSDMPDVYISRAGMESRETDRQFAQTEMSELKSRLHQMEQVDRVKTDQLRTVQNELQAIKSVIEVLSISPDASSIRKAVGHRKPHSPSVS